MLARVPEPELMDDPEQARAYSEADFSEAHDAFVAYGLARFGPIVGEVLDLGCGAADPTVRFARANPGARIVGVDAGRNMLALARVRVDRAGLDDRIRFECRTLPDDHLRGRRFDAIVSNSLLHHLASPLVLWETVAACAQSNAPILVMDLLRPSDIATVEALVQRYAGDAPAVLRADFRNSLRAAYQPDEVRAQLHVVGLDDLDVEQVSDRHLLVAGRVAAPFTTEGSP